MIATSARDPSAVVAGIEILTEIESLVLRFARCHLRQGDHFDEALGDVGAVERPVVELRRFKRAAGLGDEMLKLARQQSADFDAHRRDIACEQRQRLLARERQQRALAQDAEFARKFRDLEDAFDGVADAPMLESPTPAFPAMQQNQTSSGRGEIPHRR